MNLVSHLQCSRCGARYATDTVMNLCPVDDSPVEVVMDLERLAAEQPGLAWYRSGRKDMWRFGGLLPLDGNHPEDAAHIVSLGEGCTPLLDHADHTLAQKAGFRLRFKDEGKAHPGFGADPTQSFKDRGMTMTISMPCRPGTGRTGQG